jgi:beta-glucosidase
MKSRELLKKLSLEEKIQWTSGRSNWIIMGNEQLKVQDIIVADGPHGLRAYKEKPSVQLWGDNDLAPSTMFPSATAMASTFNEQLLFEVGETIGKECNHYEVDVLLGPGVNLKRSPLAGRNFEYYSEDPVLTSRMAVNFINGVQSQKVGACVKHFALNEQEDQRRFINTIIDERTMHEMYLRPFYNVVQESNPFMIMTSYNKINGNYAGESHHLLKDVLRDKWKYKGTVISDWGGVQNKVKSLKNGMNIEMPGPSEFTVSVNKAVQNGEVSEQEIDASLYPLMDLRDKLLLNDNKGKNVSFEEGHKIAYKVSKESIVLLENDGILPLKKDINIAVIGSFAKTPRINGGGSATLRPFKLENPLEELKKVFNVSYANGYNEEETSEELLSEVSQCCKNNDIIIFFTGTTEKVETEGKEREHMNLPKGHIEVFKEIQKKHKKVIVILNNGGALDLSPIISSNALIEAWLLGSSNAKALTEILTGDINPSGRLSETVPYCIENTPHYGLFPSKQDDVNYSGDLLRVGYRYYDTHKYPVRYPFGYGLSYTTFAYSNFVMDKKEMSDTDRITVLVDVTNTGNRSGKEVIQLYIHDRESFYPVPYKELKQFKKIDLESQETKTVTFTLTRKDFEIYAVDHHGFAVEAGEFTIMIGKNVNEIMVSDTIIYNTDYPIRTNLTLQHTLKMFSIYKKEAFEKIVTTYRDFPWYEIEEPAQRVLNRIRKQYHLDEQTFQNIVTSLLQ